MMDFSGLVLTLMITIMTLLEVDWVSIENLRTLASFASFSLSIKFYEWLRLFE